MADTQDYRGGRGGGPHEKRWFRDNGDGTYGEELSTANRVWDTNALAWVKETQPGGGGGGGAVTIADGADVAQGTTTDASSANTVVGLLKAIKAAITGTVAVSGTFWQATQPVSGTFWQATQPVSGTVTADTELPAASALADTDANPTTSRVGANALLWNGSSWDRAPGDKTNGLKVQSAQLPAALAGSGGLKVDLAGTGANATAVKVDGSAVTQPVSGTVTVNQGTANATPWNENIAQVGGVTLAATAKGTQGSNFLPVQEPKDSGRVNIAWTAEVAGAATTEGLLTVTESRDGAATTTFTSKVVTNGKRLRITSIQLAVETLGTGTAPQRVYLRLRFNTAGAATTASPLQGTWLCANNPAVVKTATSFAADFPDGIEFLGDGTKQLGFTIQFPDWVTTTATVQAKVTITAFEY